MTSRNQLRELRAVAESAIDEAKARMNDIEGAINWADLHCVEVRSWTNENGGSGLTVYIEEADPANRSLSDFVSRLIAENGWVGVDVELSW